MRSDGRRPRTILNEAAENGTTGSHYGAGELTTAVTLTAACDATASATER